MEKSDYLKLLKTLVGIGYTKTSLEVMIGLPQNGLTGIFAGIKGLSNRSMTNIDYWLSGEKKKDISTVMGKKVKEPEIQVKAVVGDFEANFTSIETIEYLHKIDLSTTDKCQELATEINNSKTLSRRDKVLLTLKVQNKLK